MSRSRFDKACRDYLRSIWPDDDPDVQLLELCDECDALEARADKAEKFIARQKFMLDTLSGAMAMERDDLLCKITDEGLHRMNAETHALTFLEERDEARLVCAMHGVCYRCGYVPHADTISEGNPGICERCADE